MNAIALKNLQSVVDHGQGPVVVPREDLQDLLVAHDDAKKLLSEYTGREVARAMRDVRESWYSHS